MSTSKETVNVKELYGKECVTPKGEFIKNNRILLSGLTDSQVEDNIRKYGSNEIDHGKPKKWYHYFIESLFSPFNSILLGIVLVLFYTDVILPDNPSYANIIVILVLVLSSTLLDFFEEFRSNKAAEKLKNLVATSATVIRNGKVFLFCRRLS